MDEVMYRAFQQELEKIAASGHRLTVAKSRQGRRPLSVDTLLAKDKAGTLHKKAGLTDLLKTPIPGTKDWFVRTGKQGLQGALKTTGRAAPRAASTVTRGGVTSIGGDELKRLGFGDLSKTGGASSEASKSVEHKLHGHTVFQGLPIAIENRKGSTREGVDPDGKPWKTTFKMPYGYIKKTEGKDGEEIDVYIGPQSNAPNAFVVHQRKIDGTGHDEDKVMLGQPSEAAARKAYLDHYNKVGPKLLGSITTMTIEELKQKLKEKSKHIKLSAVETGGDFSLGVSDPVVGGMPGRSKDKLPTAEGVKAAEVDLTNTTLYGDKAQKLRPKPGDLPDRDQAADGNKLATPLIGGSLANRKCDVPSRDGNSVDAGKVTKQDIGDQPTTVPAGGAQYTSQTGTMSR